MTTEGMSEEEKKAVKKAMDLLLHKDRTRQELRERLEKAGFSRKAEEAALAYVTSYGYIDDERYIMNYIEFHKESRSCSDIRYKLMRKGVDKELLQAVLEDYPREAEETALRKQFEKRLKGRCFSDLDRKEQQKILAAMVRKGYPLSEVKKVSVDF